jgi:thymidylate kinase
MSENRACPPMFVSFSGIDGAGKSTQIESLCKRLQEAGLQVRLITFWDDVATLKRIREGAGHKVFRGDVGVGTIEKPINRRDKNIRTPLMTVVRLLLYLLDAVSLRKITKDALKSQADVVIFDRYLYDELANLDLQKGSFRLYARWIMKLVPKPNVSFVLDGDPIEARARKPEYPLEFLTFNRVSFLTLGKILSGITLIPPMSIDEVRAEVDRKLAESLRMQVK